MHDQEYVHTNYIARLVPQYGNVQRIILAGGAMAPPGATTAYTYIHLGAIGCLITNINVPVYISSISLYRPIFFCVRNLNCQSLITSRWLT